MKFCAVLMPLQPIERAILDGQRWDLDEIERLEALGFVEARVREHFTGRWEPYRPPTS
jgi:hypothetical protein